MSVKLIQDRLDSYHCQSHLEQKHAIREIMQEVVLAALGRTEFFKDALFQGGTHSAVCRQPRRGTAGWSWNAPRA